MKSDGVFMDTYLFWCGLSALAIVLIFFRNSPFIFPAILVGFIVAVGVASGLYVQSGEAAKDEAARIKRESEENTPHVIREADGCKVYAFKSGERYHYFTRCGCAETVSTERTYQECRMAGKAKKCQDKSEVIATTTK